MPLIFYYPNKNTKVIQKARHNHPIGTFLEVK